MGFDGLMLNEHHSTPFCMGGVMNVEAAILARITKRAKIVLLGNVLPIWDDPLWLAEMLAEIDMISRGPPGVRLGARHRPRERRPQRAAALQLGALPGGARLRREGVDQAGPVPLGGRALPLPLREPVGAAVPGPAPAHLDSRRHVAATRWRGRRKHRYPYIMLATELEPTRQSFHYYDECAEGARLRGRPPAPRLPVQGPRGRDRGAGRAGRAQATSRARATRSSRATRATSTNFIQNLPGLTSRTQLLPTVSTFAAAARGQGPHQRRTARSSRPTSTARTSSRSRRCPSSPARRRRSSPRSARCSRRCARARSSSGTATAPWTTTTRCAPCGSWARRSSPPAARWPRSWTCPAPSTIDPATNKKLDATPAEPSVNDRRVSRAGRRRRRGRPGRLDGGDPPGPTGPGRDAARAGAVSPRPHRRVAPARVDAHPGRAGRAAPPRGRRAT